MSLSPQAIQETIDSIMELLNKTIQETAEASKNTVIELHKFALRTKLDCVILAPVVFLPQGKFVCSFRPFNVCSFVLVFSVMRTQACKSVRQ